MPRALLAGESWSVHSIHQKGFDSFTTTEYAEGGGHLIAALEGAGWEVTYQPAHVAARDFPATAEALSAWDVVILSDVGANTLLLHPDTFIRSRPLPDRLAAVRDYVGAGGGLIMVGGYLTFQGIEAKARYAGTPVEEALPVTISHHDDRVERTGGRRTSPCPTGSPDPRWGVRNMARAPGLQPSPGQARGRGCGLGGRRSAGGRGSLWPGPRGSLRKRLRPALGAATLCQLGRLRCKL